MRLPGEQYHDADPVPVLEQDPLYATVIFPEDSGPIPWAIVVPARSWFEPIEDEL